MKDEGATKAAGEQMARLRERFQAVRAEVQKVIVGHTEIIDGVLTCLLADGHVLLEGVPGLGKTILVRTLADVVQLDFGRVQFTPDLMPADIIGTNMIVSDDRGAKRFEFVKGPLFTNILLADEINRATPKTQSALLQAMAERYVSVGTQSYPLPNVYFVLATQNPLEQEGTYPLPEAQLDRFMFKLNVAFPDLEELNTIMNRTTSGQKPEVSSILAESELLEMREIARRVPIADHVQRFALQILQRTHPTVEGAPAEVLQYVKVGASPRAGQAMLACARIRALVRGETAVAFEDIESVATPALRHRVLLNFEGEAEGVQLDDVIETVIRSLR